jgi:hypothetical protein
MWVSSIMGLGKLILPGGRNRPGGYMTTVSEIGNTDSRWDEEMGKGPHLEVRAQYSLPDRTNVTNT